MATSTQSTPGLNGETNGLSATGQNGTNGAVQNGISLNNDHDQRRFSAAESLDQGSISGERSLYEDDEGYLIRMQNSRQPSIALDRSENHPNGSVQDGVMPPTYTPLICHPHKFSSFNYRLKQSSETVKSSPIKLMIFLPIGFPQHGHPNLTKEILSSLKLSLDGVLGEDTGLTSKNVLVVIQIEFGWLETTVELLKKFGALSRDRDELAGKVDGVPVVAQMFESTIRPGIGNAENLMQTVVLIPPKNNEHALDSDQWTTSLEADVKPWVSIKIPVRHTVRASLLKAYWKKANESTSLGHKTERVTYDVKSVSTTSKALKEKFRSS